MAEHFQQSLETIADEDPVARPLARLQLEALQAASDPYWDKVVADRPEPDFGTGTPVLHGQRIEIRGRKANDLVNQLANTLADIGELEPWQTRKRFSDVRACALLEASIEWDHEAIVEIADELGTEPAVAGTVGQSAALPLLLAFGRGFASGSAFTGWDPGYCPVCGSWPILAEQRGLHRQQWLRCNRCAAAWQSRHQRCVFCDNSDHETLGYMAPEAERESRRVVTCERCGGYLKVFASVAPLGAADILRLDLQSLELDIAALDEGYARPDRPGFAVEIDLVPSQHGARRWWPWP